MEDAIWRVVAGECPVLCLACFDQRAECLGVEYRDSVAVLGRRCWMGGSFDGPALIQRLTKCDKRPKVRRNCKRSVTEG